MPNNTLSRADLRSDGIVYDIHYGDVIIKFGSILDMGNEDVPYIANGKEGKTPAQLQDGDIVIADTAEDETAGKAVEIYNAKRKRIEAGLHTIPCRPISAYAPMYLGYYMNSAFYHSQLLSLLQGVKVLSISKANISKTVITSPQSKIEQEKISSVLYLIDLKVKKQRQVIDTLKKYKRGAVRHLLSVKSCPLRNARWTTAKMGELGSFVKGAPLSKADISEDGTPFILYGELYTTYNEVVTSVKRRTQAQVNELFLSRVGDVVIPTSGETPEEISTASCVMLPGVILAGDLNIFRGDKVDGRIMSYLLNHVVNAKIARIAQGKSVVHVQASELCKLTLTYPDKSTQNTIIGFLSLLDDKIMNEENALAFLSDLKEGLLQQLFI